MDLYPFGEVNARANRPDLQELQSHVARSLQRLGVERVFKGHFPNIEFNTVPHLKLVQFIEQAIRNHAPTSF
jgi:hypothetical protein